MPILELVRCEKALPGAKKCQVWIQLVQPIREERVLYATWNPVHKEFHVCDSHRSEHHYLKPVVEVVGWAAVATPVLIEIEQYEPPQDMVAKLLCMSKPRKLELVKLIRAQFDLSLKQSREIVEQVLNQIHEQRKGSAS